MNTGWEGEGEFWQGFIPDLLAQKRKTVVLKYTAIEYHTDYIIEGNGKKSRSDRDACGKSVV